MFGKLFQSCFTGSMIGAGTHVFAVWHYAIAHAVKSRVELNPVLLAAILGSDVKTVESALEYLCAPDPRSRTPANEGRRLIKEGQFQYFLPTHEHYRAIRNNDDRREYNCQKKREERQRKQLLTNVSKSHKRSANVSVCEPCRNPQESAAPMSNGVSMTVNDSQRKSTLSAHTETEAERETQGGGPPLFDPVKKRLFRREYEGMISDAKAEIKAVRENPQSWVEDISDRADELLDLLKKENPGDLAKRKAEILNDRSNWVRVKLRKSAVAVLDAWKKRIAEIKATMNGIVN